MHTWVSQLEAGAGPDLATEPQLFQTPGGFPTFLPEVPFRHEQCVRGWEPLRNAESRARLQLWNRNPNV